MSGNETGFEIERQSGSFFVTIATVGAGVTSYTDLGLANGTHTYRLRTYTKLGSLCWRSAYSDTASATILVPILIQGPPAPSNLAATVLSSSSVKLGWTDNAEGETGFKVERSSGGGAWSVVATLGPNLVACTDTGLTAGTAYSYRVRAHSSFLSLVLYSGYSNVATATPVILIGPAPPTQLTAQSSGSLSITLNWVDNATGENGFKVECAIGSGAWSQIAAPGPDVTTYVHTGLTLGTNYRYRVRAHDTLLSLTYHSAYSNEASATVVLVLNFAPTAPSGALATATGATTAALTWADNSTTEGGFKIERRAGGGVYALIVVAGPNETAYTNTGLSPETIYTYRVRAYSLVLGTAWHSAYTNETTATTPAALAPAEPANLRLASSGQTSSSLALLWDDRSSNETGFSLERRLPGGHYLALAELPAGTTSFTDTGLMPGITCGYRIRAFRIGGGIVRYSGYANEYEGSTLPPPAAPAAPSGLAVTAGTEATVTLGWIDNSTSEIGFTIERKGGDEADAEDFALIGTVAAGATTYNDETVLPGTAYTYRIHAYHAYGVSAYSNSAEVTTPGTPPSEATRVVELRIDNLSYFVDGQEDNLDAAPVLMGGRTLLPIRVIIEALGGTAGWDPATRKATVTLGANTVEVWVGQNTGMVNGQPRPLDAANPAVVPLILPPGRTFLPLRFVTENLGCAVQWDPALQKVTVIYPAP